MDARRSGADWNGEVWPQADQLGEPFKWRKPRSIFPCSLSDLFHPKVPFEYIAAAFGVMAATPWHRYLILTKRIDRYAEFMKWIDDPEGGNLTWDGSAGGDCGDYAIKAMGSAPIELAVRSLNQPWPLPNVWIGVSVSDQPTFAQDVPKLLKAPAAHRWCSYEPGLGYVDFDYALDPRERDIDHRELADGPWSGVPLEAKLEWVVLGGESGSDARPFDLAWARTTIGECRAAGVPVLVKQLGSDPIEYGKRIDLAAWKGDVMSEWPADLRVQEFPSWS